MAVCFLIDDLFLNRFHVFFQMTSECLFTVHWISKGGRGGGNYWVTVEVMMGRVTELGWVSWGRAFLQQNQSIYL